MITIYITYTAMHLFCFCMWFFISGILLILEGNGLIRIKKTWKAVAFILFTAPASFPCMLIALLMRGLNHIRLIVRKKQMLK